MKTKTLNEIYLVPEDIEWLANDSDKGIVCPPVFLPVNIEGVEDRAVKYVPAGSETGRIKKLILEKMKTMVIDSVEDETAYNTLYNLRKELI